MHAHTYRTYTRTHTHENIHTHAHAHAPASTAGFQAMEGSISSTPGVGLAYTMEAPWCATYAEGAFV